MSSSKVFQKRWQEVDREMKTSFMHQLTQHVRNIFTSSCYELLV